MGDTNELLICRQYSELLDTIFIYRDQQVELRMMCSKIMLGSIALTGGLLYAKLEITGQQLLILGAVFPILSLLIVTVNLLSDLVYKERLKLAFVSEAIRLENGNLFLPQFHTHILNQKGSKLPADGQSVFYFGAVALLLLLSAMALSFLPAFEDVVSKGVIFVIYIAVFALYCKWISKVVKHTNVILKELENG